MFAGCTYHIVGNLMLQLKYGIESLPGVTSFDIKKTNALLTSVTMFSNETICNGEEYSLVQFSESQYLGRTSTCDCK